MYKSKKTMRLIFSLFVSLIFLASCGDSSKEAKVDKVKDAQKTEMPASSPPPSDSKSADEPTEAEPSAEKMDAEPEPEVVEPAPEAEAMKEPAPQAEADAEPKPEPVAAPTPEPSPKPAEEVKPEAEPKVAATPAPEPKPEPEPVVEPTPEPEVKPVVKKAKTSGQCPQPRKTKSAPSNIAKMDKTGNANADNGKKVYTKTAKPMACKMCHGDNGDGGGKLGAILKPPPRNFTCADSMKGVSAGQMFWIIKNGSKGTGMVAHGKTLKDAAIWDVVKFIREDFVN